MQICLHVEACLHETICLVFTAQEIGDECSVDGPRLNTSLPPQFCVPKGADLLLHMFLEQRSLAYGCRTVKVNEVRADLSTDWCFHTGAGLVAEPQ